MILSKKELGELVKNARKVKSKKIGKLYTQKMLASDLNKSQSYIGDIESGRTYPSFVLLTQIAEACGVPISFFQDENYNKNIEKFIKSRLNKEIDEDVSHIVDHMKSDPGLDMDYIRDYLKNNSEVRSNFQGDLFNTSEEAVKFLLSQPVIANFLGVNITELAEQDTFKFIDDCLNQIKLVSYKYRK